MSPPGSPLPANRSRPQSMILRGRSNSRTSKQGGSGSSDEVHSIKVAIRIRPPLQPSDPGWDLIPQRFQRPMVHTSSPNSLDVDAPQGRRRFAFDQVFGPEMTQRDVWEHLQETIDNALGGYNVAILCYGQSGAGKSYTMGTSGPAEQNDPTLKGIVPRAAAYLFEQLNATNPRALRPPSSYPLASTNGVSNDRKWKMTATYVEIYNENLRDLLLPETTPLNERSPLVIREDKGKVIVTGLREVEVKTVDQLLSILNHGSEIRQTDATTINAKSSRSHAIFTLNLIQHKSHAALQSTKEKRRSMSQDATVSSEPGVTLDSKIHFTDLAGSERLKNTNATGERAKEGIAINSGLANLGKCIAQLSARQTGTHGHVSYRDSRLTRILQNSLGGDALTYMIASINPSEFYLQETLNTLQYATRMRMIKIAPVVQQVDEEGDRQALIERLKAEVGWLRQQLRSSEAAEKKPAPAAERSDRPNEREIELQNQLMDFQESYNALSQRHAKSIAELAKSGEAGEDATPQSTTDASIERLKRSRANQQQIEEMVLEYEKTIQTLELNLSNTRASLAVTEGNLLEKETRCAYTDTVNQQLHSRMQKLNDREANTEKYMRELEGRLDGHSSGEEKNGAMIAELRKEVARMRESESNSEDYISTLEERLAEADQDMDLVQREVQRLEHVVDRQRSIGKLDNLLFELDNARSGKATPTVSGRPVSRKGQMVHALKEAKSIPLPETTDDDLEESALPEFQPEAASHEDSDRKSLARIHQRDVEAQPSPAQARHMAEKFESVSGELFDLRIEHESTMNEFDLLQAKYQTALRTLAEMQGVAEDRQSTRASSASIPVGSRRTSVGETKAEPVAAGKGGLSYRSTSSELPTDDSSAADADTTETSRGASRGELSPSPDIKRLNQLLNEQDRDMDLVTQKYAQLENEHEQTLEMVRDLKAEINKKSLSSSPLSPVIRRATSQNLIVDRANRPLASLRALIAEELDGRSNKLEAAEIHFSAASHELQSRIERIAILEGEVNKVKKEMDAKTAIIHGLTKERNNLRGSSPVDLSMVTQMRDRLIENETQMKSLHESHASREEELMAKVQSLESNKELPALPVEHGTSVSDLERELSDWKAKHEVVVDSMQASEKRLLTTTAELDATKASVDAIKAQLAADGHDEAEREAAVTAMQVEREKHTVLIESLKQSIDDHKSQAARLEQRGSSLRQLVSQHERDLSSKDKQLASQDDQLKTVESVLDEQRSSIEQHKQGLKKLHETHETRVEEMKLAHAGQLAEMDDQLAAMKRDRHMSALSVQSGVDANSDLGRLLSRVGKVLGHSTSVEMLHNHIQDLKEEKSHAMEVHSRLTKTNADLERRLEDYRETKPEVGEKSDAISEYQAKVRTLAEEVANHEETLRMKDETIRKRDATIEHINVEKVNNARIIEELEQQIETSFDHHNNRLSVIQQQGSHALVEAQARVAALERDLEAARAGSDADPSSRSNTMRSHRPQSPPMDAANRTSSMTSNLRKSASVASLPSPPPNLPLPPLPALPSMAAVNGLQAPNQSSTSPPGSRHTSKEIPITSPHQTQVIEEQENRIRTVEKHLNAEKQLTATLEEALVDLETQSNKLRQEMETWKKKAWTADEELTGLRRDKKTARESLQAVELERDRRREAEAARAQLEERMNQLSRKKKKNALNCF